MHRTKVSHSSSTTTTSEIMLDDNISELAARQYQIEIMEQAKTENLIVCLPTGSGKTMIAILLIEELSPITRLNLQGGGKRTVLLVKTIELARQHSITLSKQSALKTKNYCSSPPINLNDRNRWNDEFENHQVFIFTPQKFLHLLGHGLIQLDKINLLIFDECHHATGDNPYAMIMKTYYTSCFHPPRILGLTASISGQKIGPKQLEKDAKELEMIYKARIETGSDHKEIIRNSTSVNVKQQRCQNYQQLCQKDKRVIDIFKTIELLLNELEKYLKTKKIPVRFENDSSKVIEQSNFIQIQCRTLGQLKSHLDNIIHLGYDLGLYGFSLGIKALTDYLRPKNLFIEITDSYENGLYTKIIQTLDDLVNKDIQNLTESHKILYSDKVIKVKEYIEKNQSGQCIVFVERVYTAAFLCQVLRKLVGSTYQIKYLAGSKAYIDEISVSNKYQREVVEEFRRNDIQVLISTAIVEEGLDVSGCNLVIRFNKPQNFSSYMQSKGRARSKTGDALFVVLEDESDFDRFVSNKLEYKDYDYMEKMLRQNFRPDCDTHDSSNDDRSLLKPYRPGNGVNIDAIHAIQMINQYCAVLGNGQFLSPRFLFYIDECNVFKCILSMPASCPIRDDIECGNRTKKLAKQECCLQMVQILHEKGELDEHCLPIRPERCLTDDSSDDEDTEKPPIEIIDKQISYFPPEPISSSNYWYLYRINVSNNDDLGFILPTKIIKLPMFNLCTNNEKITVQLTYVEAINYNECKYQLEHFCRYLFEQVFDEMNTGDESMLKFDIEHSTFKLLPCLLKKSGEIDYQRMATICQRKNKLIQNLSDLNDKEVYIPLNPPDKQLYRFISDVSFSKRAGDLWNYKRPIDTFETYADHFECKSPDIHIQRDRPMATMKSYKKPRKNYLTDSLSKKDKQSISSSDKDKLDYFPIEVLRYAPLNQQDYELIYKLPSILIRISQLYYIEQLRKILADNIQSYSLLDVGETPTVTFDDCLTRILSSTQLTVLPLVSLNYNLLSGHQCRFQPSPGILFQAITRRSAAENTDMENLEILGDCFLKLGMSMSLYHQFPLGGSGKLTSKKDRQVSNENLHRLAMKNKLKDYLYVNRLIYGGDEANWVPPSYKIDEKISEGYTKQKAKRKGFADMMEALIGAFLISTDYLTTIKFMKWLGLDTIPIDEQNEIMETPSILYPGLSNTMDGVITAIQKLYVDRNFAEIEENVHYVFANKAYLIAAFTHPSYCNNRLTQCYERLEYLGDAVLDFLIIRCVFVEHYENVTPSQVTSIRQDLSNNGRLAYILVSCDLHKKILHGSPDLYIKLGCYLQNENIFLENQSLENKLSKDIDQWADSTAPKALADVFEALVGAIFLDSGYSLEIVWNIIEPLLRTYIKRSIKNPNLNPVRSFFERQGEIISESNDGKGNFICIVKLPDGNEFKGYGKNKKLAKYDACRRAITIS